MNWSVSGGILTLSPTTPPLSMTPGWIVAPYRPPRRESFAVEAVVKYVLPVPGWSDPYKMNPHEVGISVHLGPQGAHQHFPHYASPGTGVSLSYLNGGSMSGIVWLSDRSDAAKPGGGRIVGYGNTPSVTDWTTYRLAVRYDRASGQDAYTFRINGVKVAMATLGDWMQYHRIAFFTDTAMQVKSLSIYRLH